MDVNQTSYHHWLVREDWIDAEGRSAFGEGERTTELDYVDGALQRRPQLRVVAASPRDRALGPEHRRGMVLLPSGLALVVDGAQRTILELAPDGCQRSFWSSPARRIGPLALDDEGRLHVILQPERAEGRAALLRIDLVTAEISELTLLGEGEVLDCALVRGPGGQRLAILRANGRRIALHGLEGAALAALTIPRACAVEGLPDGTLALLRSEAEGVVICRRAAPGEEEGDWPDQAVAALAAPLLADGEALPARTGHDLIWVQGAGPAEGRLFVCDQGGNQAFALRFHGEAGAGAPWLGLDTELYPLTHFGGRGLVAGPDGARYDVERGDSPGLRGLAPVVASRRRSYDRGEIRLTLRPVDSRIPACTWHRIVLEARVPAGCGITLEARVADDAGFSGLGPEEGWCPLPPLCRRSRAEIGGHRPADPVWDALLVDLSPPVDDDAGAMRPLRGRYLQLRLHLRNTKSASPRITALRAWYPRFSYLEHYLPAVWREVDPAQNHFAERFLANVEGLFTDLEEGLVAATALFDPRVAPADALPWLASWFAVSLDPGWTEAQRRFFLRHAVRMFNMRGTCAGVAAAARLGLAPTPSEAVFEPDERLVRVREHHARRTPTPTAAQARSLGLWHPDDGRADLGRRIAEAGHDESFGLRAPAGAEREAWARFFATQLGFVPAASDADLPRWRRFLLHRYRTPEALARAWGRWLDSFEAAPMLDSPGQTEAALRDWYLFETVVLPTLASAHRFTVSVLDPQDEGRRLALRRLVTRAVAVERPAHTAFEVRFHSGDVEGAAPARRAFELDDSALDGADRLVHAAAETLAAPVQTLDHIALGEGHLAALPELPPPATSSPKDAP